MIARYFALLYSRRKKITLNLGGRDLNSFTLIDRPIRVAMLQCGIVGVKTTFTFPFESSTATCSNLTTSNCSSVNGCSGSFIPLKIKTVFGVMGSISLYKINFD